jgi:CDP-4-dehydro-6-deoxyglucose reductase, E3
MHGAITRSHDASYVGFGIFGKMFEAKLSSGLRSFAVAKDEAILTAALRAGVNLSHLCRRGTCGACRATIAQGEVRQDIFRPAALPYRDREAGHVLLCCSRALSDVVIDAPEVSRPPEFPRRIPARVVSLERPTSEVAVVTLRVPSIEPFDYVPGKYVGIVGPDGFARAFSIANAPRSDRTFELHIGRVQNGSVSNHVYQRLNVGDVIQIETPQGSNHSFLDEGRPLIGIVGGTGYAPMQAILEDWTTLGLHKEVHLYWGSRLPSGFYAMRAAVRLVSSFPRSTFTPVVSSGNLDDGWTGRRGLVHLAALSDFSDLRNADVFVCGPPGLVDAAERDCLANGLSADRFYADAFSIVKSFEKFEGSCHPSL